MTLDLVIDIGHARIKGALFDGKTLIDAFWLASPPTPKEKLTQFLQGRTIRNVFVSSINPQMEEELKHTLQQAHINYYFLDYKVLKMGFEVDEPHQLGADRIANAYGALVRFPLNDCIVVDIGSAITVDFVAKEGRYLGGMIYPGAPLCAQALHTYHLPLIKLQKPSSALAKTTETHLQSGIYYGQLGAIERMIAELSLSAISPSSVKILATGSSAAAYEEDLAELVDLIDPHLTLVGLHEILSETLSKKKE